MQSLETRIETAARWMTRAAAFAVLSVAAVTVARADTAVDFVPEAASSGSLLPYGVAVLVMLALAYFGIRAWRQHHPHPAPRVGKPAPAPRREMPARPLPAQHKPAPIPAKAVVAAQIETIEYTPFKPVLIKQKLELQATSDEPVREATPVRASAESGASRILDRYVAARFPGVATRIADLSETERTIKCARLLFEDGRAARARELLKLATENFPAVPDLWLASLELAFLDRDLATFQAQARFFHDAHAANPAWPMVRNMAEALCTRSPDGGRDAGDFPDYGGWLELPNWLQAPRDLTPEIAASELHARLKARGEQKRVPMREAA